ncbi:MAG TPA: alpha/beta hydrolase [Blastocatellia bacterium]|nr:alpha/beta hydrolase [Blastocatellia bacterium]
MQPIHCTLGGLDTLIVESGEASLDRPLIIAIHGRGASAEDLIPILPEIFPNSVVGIFPNGPLCMQLGAWGLGHAWYELGSDQPQTLRESRQQLTTLLNEVREKFQVPLDRTFLSGFSQGAVMTLEVGLRYPERLAGLIALSGYLPEPDVIIQEAVRDPKRQILVAHGTSDDVVPVEAGRLVNRELVELGYKVAYREFPVGHSIDFDEMAFIRDWIQSRLDAAE